jgi:hypothetical protein
VSKIDPRFPGAWDTSALFEALLADFERLAERSRSIRSSQPPGTELHHFAMSGFLLFQPPSSWGADQYAFISRALEGDFALEELDWFEGAAPAVQAFACVAFGALLGKYSADQIDQVGFQLGCAHLSAFLFMENDAMLARYEAYRTKHAPESP